MNKPDSTGEGAGEELDMDGPAQEGWSSSLVVPERRPAPERSWRAAMSERLAASLGGWPVYSASANVTKRELLEAAHHGDEDAFRHLVETHRPPLLAHCYRHPRRDPGLPAAADPVSSPNAPPSPARALSISPVVTGCTLASPSSLTAPRFHPDTDTGPDANWAARQRPVSRHRGACIIDGPGPLVLVAVARARPSVTGEFRRGAGPQVMTEDDFGG